MLKCTFDRFGQYDFVPIILLIAIGIIIHDSTDKYIPTCYNFKIEPNHLQMSSCALELAEKLLDKRSIDRPNLKINPQSNVKPKAFLRALRPSFKQLFGSLNAILDVLHITSYKNFREEIIALVSTVLNSNNSLVSGYLIIYSQIPIVNSIKLHPSARNAWSIDGHWPPVFTPKELAAKRLEVVW